MPERESIERGFPYLLSAQKLVRAVFVKNGEGVGELGPQRYNAATYSVTVFKEVASTWVWSGTVKSTQSSPLGTVCSRESYCGQFSHVLLSVGCEEHEGCMHLSRAQSRECVRVQENETVIAQASYPWV